MRAWLVTIGEPLPSDGTNERLLRAGILAGVLGEAGHDVTWWSSTFDHVRKHQRFAGDTALTLHNGVRLRLLHGCGYRRNVSLARLIDHTQLARKFAAQAPVLPEPDVILCSLPPLELPAAVAQYGRARGVPVVIDVRDLWPDIFLELVPRWARPLANVALAPLWRDARSACANAAAISGNSPDFVEWGLRQAGRPAHALDRDFPFGYAPPRLSADADRRAADFWDKLGVRQDDGVFTVCFMGVFSHQFDLDTVIDAARALEQGGHAVRFVLCGAGEYAGALKTRAAGVSSVIFPGWIGAAEIWTLMQRSDMGLMPYRPHAGHTGNLPNKPIEYMAAGLPLLSCLTGYVEDFLERHSCGVTYRSGSSESLQETLVRLMRERRALERMGANAARLFDERFSARKVYGEMARYLEDVARSAAGSHRGATR